LYEAKKINKTQDQIHEGHNVTKRRRLNMEYMEYRKEARRRWKIKREISAVTVKRTAF
jgi:hypothetical protein